jgi:hypothetical protein
VCGSWGAAQEEGEGEIRRPCRRLTRAVVAAAALFAIVPAALGGNPPLPWAGGAAVETPFERFAGQLVSAIARRPVNVVCNGKAEWGELAARRRVDALSTWGFVVFDYDASTESRRPGDTMQLAQTACWYLDQYWRAPRSEKGKRCRITTHITVHEGRTIAVSRYGTCPDYRNRVFALQTISHESQHLAGIEDEAIAECNGMLALRSVAERFGATPADGVQMARDYYHDVYLAKRPGTPYYLATCPDPAP